MADIHDFSDMTSGDMRGLLYRQADEIEQLRTELSAFACDCDHRCESMPSQLASDGGCRRYKARLYL